MNDKKPLPQQTIDKFWDFFPPVWHTVRARIHQEAVEKFDITVVQYHIMRRIRRGTDSVSALAADRHTSRPSISRAVDVLVNKGLVTRTTNPADRRNVQLSLTPKGQALMETLSAHTRAWMAEKLGVLNETELQSILDGGDALHKAFFDGDR